MQVKSARHAWHEKQGFSLSREHGDSEYVFLHCWTPLVFKMGKETVATQPHACIVFDIGAPRVFSSPDCELIHDWMHISGGVKDTLAALGLQTGTFYYPADFAFITELVRGIEREHLAKEPYYETVIDAKLWELFAFLARTLCGGGSVVPNADEGLFHTFCALRTKILSEVEKPWDADSLAKTAGVSVSGFYRLYRQFFGVSPRQDLIIARIERAKHLLLALDSVSQTADALGYGDPGHFVRQFKKIAGVTPKQYLQKTKQTARS